VRNSTSNIRQVDASSSHALRTSTGSASSSIDGGAHATAATGASFDENIYFAFAAASATTSRGAATTSANTSASTCTNTGGIIAPGPAGYLHTGRGESGPFTEAAMPVSKMGADELMTATLDFADSVGWLVGASTDKDCRAVSPLDNGVREHEAGGDLAAPLARKDSFRAEYLQTLVNHADSTTAPVGAGAAAPTKG